MKGAPFVLFRVILINKHPVGGGGRLYPLPDFLGSLKTSVQIAAQNFQYLIQLQSDVLHEKLRSFFFDNMAFWWCHVSPFWVKKDICSNASRMYSFAAKRNQKRQNIKLKALQNGCLRLKNKSILTLEV